MKKFQGLGRSLSKEEQKTIVGGVVPVDDSGCTITCSGTNGSDSSQTCDYTFSGGSCDGRPPLCEAQCVNGCSTLGSSCIYP